MRGWLRRFLFAPVREGHCLVDGAGPTAAPRADDLLEGAGCARGGDVEDDRSRPPALVAHAALDGERRPTRDGGRSPVLVRTVQRDLGAHLGAEQTADESAEAAHRGREGQPGTGVLGGLRVGEAEDLGERDLVAAEVVGGPDDLGADALGLPVAVHHDGFGSGRAAGVAVDLDGDLALAGRRREVDATGAHRLHGRLVLGLRARLGGAGCLHRHACHQRAESAQRPEGDAGPDGGRTDGDTTIGVHDLHFLGAAGTSGAPVPGRPGWGAHMFPRARPYGAAGTGPGSRVRPDQAVLTGPRVTVAWGAIGRTVSPQAL